jgi:hypothetical protein
VFSSRRSVSLGFRAKTGRAIAVALAATEGVPSLVDRREIGLVDPHVDVGDGPYHTVMELPWAEGQVAVQGLVSVVERFAVEVVTSLVRELRSRGFDVVSVGVTGSPDRDLRKIGNFHIRAHAAEGILFRRVLEVAAAANGIRYRTVSDRLLANVAESELSSRGVSVSDSLKAMGRVAGPPWRTDERAAATVAWLALAG